MTITNEQMEWFITASPNDQREVLNNLANADLNPYDQGIFDSLIEHAAPAPDVDDTPEFISAAKEGKMASVFRGIVASSDMEKARGIVKSNPEVYHSPEVDKWGQVFLYERQDDGSSIPLYINKSGASKQDLVTFGTETAMALPAFRVARVGSIVAKGKKARILNKVAGKYGHNSPKADDALNVVWANKPPGIRGTASNVLNNLVAPTVGKSTMSFGAGAAVTDLARQGASKGLGYRDDIDLKRAGLTGLAAAAGSVPGTYLAKSGLTKPLGAKLTKSTKISQSTQEIADKFNIPVTRAEVYARAKLEDDTIRFLEKNMKMDVDITQGFRGMAEDVMRSPRVLNRIPLNQAGYNMLSGHSAGNLFAMPSAPEIAGMGTVGLMKLSTDF